MERALEKLAEQILSFDEASLVHLREKYRLRIENFDGTNNLQAIDEQGAGIGGIYIYAYLKH